MVVFLLLSFPSNGENIKKDCPGVNYNLFNKLQRAAKRFKTSSSNNLYYLQVKVKFKVQDFISIFRTGN